MRVWERKKDLGLSLQVKRYRSLDLERPLLAIQDLKSNRNVNSSSSPSGIVMNSQQEVVDKLPLKKAVRVVMSQSILVRKAALAEEGDLSKILNRMLISRNKAAAGTVRSTNRRHSKSSHHSTLVTKLKVKAMVVAETSVINTKTSSNRPISIAKISSRTTMVVMAAVKVVDKAALEVAVVEASANIKKLVAIKVTNKLHKAKSNNSRRSSHSLNKKKPEWKHLKLTRLFKNNSAKSTLILTWTLSSKMEKREKNLKKVKSRTLLIKASNRCTPSSLNYKTL